MTGDETAAPGGTASKASPPAFDTSVAHQARVYDYMLGGKDNYAADRAAAEASIKVWPDIALGAQANRAFLGRAVRYLAGEAGIRQFLDIGTGIPTAGNTHQVAQAIAPESRVVYVDYDRCKPGCSHGRRVRRMSSARADAGQPLTGRQSRADLGLSGFLLPTVLGRDRCPANTPWCG
jgi:S-adenosyl methyltransferase